MVVTHHKRKQWLERRRKIVDEKLSKIIAHNKSQAQAYPTLQQEQREVDELYSRNKISLLKTRDEEDLELEQLAIDLSMIFPEKIKQANISGIQKKKDGTLVLNSIQNQKNPRIQDIENIYSKGLTIKRNKELREIDKKRNRQNQLKKFLSQAEVFNQEPMTIETIKRPQ